MNFDRTEFTFEIMRRNFLEAINLGIDTSCIKPVQEVYGALPAKILEADKRTALDQAMRDHLLCLLNSPGGAPQELAQWQHFLALCVEACRLQMASPTLPVVFLSDIFETATLDYCEQLFSIVENGVAVWKEELFFSACKNNLLRMCNDLLRRLSRSQNTIFCGRILLFLAKFFPFSERSGLNIVSEFNLENVTEFGGEEMLDCTSVTEDKDELADEMKPENKIQIDYNLYTKFWALQDFFRDPNQCYDKLQWKIFSSHAENVLSAFKSSKLEATQSREQRVEAAGVCGPEQHYFAKYLTNQKLLELQLCDSNFRRSVLIQFLILFQYLNSQVKFKQENFELKPEQSDWVNEMTQQVFTLLKETPPEGEKLVATVQHILKGEEHWNNWKNEGCPALQKPGSEESGSMEKDEPEKKRPSRKNRPKLGDLMKEAHANNQYLLGHSELTKLWNHAPDNLEACRAPERDFLPSLEDYFEESIDQTNPLAMIEEQYKRVNDGNFGWRALRLLARRSPHFFTHSNNPINTLPEYLETMVRKIAKERPAMATVGGQGRPVEIIDVEPDVEEEAEEELLKEPEAEEGERNEDRGFLGDST